MMTRLLLLRHAKTQWNAERRIQGQKDLPLSPAGEAQALGWAGEIAKRPFDAVLASDLARARRTAEIVAAGRDVPVETDPRLREQDWGRWVGLTVPEIEALPECAVQAALGWEFRPPGGESRREVLGRVMAALADAAMRHAGRTLLVVAHKGPIRLLLYHLSGTPFQAARPAPFADYRLHVLACEDGMLRIEHLNGTLAP